MKFSEVRELVQLLKDSNISELKIEKDDFKLLLRTQAYTEALLASKQNAGKQSTVVMPMPASPPFSAPVQEDMSTKNSKKQNSDPVSAEKKDIPPVPEPSSDVQLETVASPMIGTFYRSASPDKPPFVKIGQHINKGDVLCIIEAMKLFNEIQAETSGTITKVLVEDASPVEYDQPLFLVKTN